MSAIHWTGIAHSEGMLNIVRAADGKSVRFSLFILFSPTCFAYHNLAYVVEVGYMHSLGKTDILNFRLQRAALACLFR